MLYYYLISIDNVPYKLYKSQRDVDDALDWFRRMSRYDANEYIDYDDFIKIGVRFYDESDVTNRVRVTLLEVEH